MGLYTQQEKEQLVRNPEVRKRLSDFISMSGKDFFREVQARLSPEDLNDYLKENPEEGIYLMTPPSRQTPE